MFESSRAALGPGARTSEVYAPIGLNLKADTPEEMALSIMSEIVAVRRGGKAGFMKNG